LILLKKRKRPLLANRITGKNQFVPKSNPAMNRHFKLQIKTLENAPRRDADKLQESKKQKKGKNQHNSP
jgi:hypothetical protein